MLRAAGYFSYEPVDVNGQQVRPIDVTARLLFPKWKLKPGEGDFTVMRITVEGVENGRPKTFTYDLLDKYDDATGTISMARTTGFTCTAVANLLLSGQFERKGICPPEYIGETEENFRFILEYLKARGVEYRLS